MALFTTQPRLRLYVYFHALDNPDWTLSEATYTDPATGALATIAADAVWMRSDDVGAEPPEGGVQATIQNRATGPTGAQAVVVPPSGGTLQPSQIQAKPAPVPAPKTPKTPKKRAKLPARKGSPKKKGKKAGPRKPAKKLVKRKTKASRKK
jgi:hypothetical protein